MRCRAYSSTYHPISKITVSNYISKKQTLLTHLLSHYKIELPQRRDIPYWRCLTGSSERTNVQFAVARPEVGLSDIGQIAPWRLSNPAILRICCNSHSKLITSFVLFNESLQARLCWRPRLGSYLRKRRNQAGIVLWALCASITLLVYSCQNIPHSQLNLIALLHGVLAYNNVLS